jgi:hypothetical protein
MPVRIFRTIPFRTLGTLGRAPNFGFADPATTNDCVHRNEVALRLCSVSVP